MPKLVITDAEGSRTIALDREVKAGRLAENDIPLKVPEASRHHCRFFDEKGTWFVEDMGSSNGTLVNGRKVSKFELQDGDLISVGAVTMRFLDSAPTAAETGAAAGGWGEDEISLEEQVFLVLGAPGRHGEVVRVQGDKLTVGRKGRHGLVLSEASVSQDHAEIRKSGSDWVLADLGSSNGTFLDGERVREAKLRSGAVVSFGDVSATFGIGDPKDFRAPEAAEAAEEPERAQAETTILDSESAFADPTFALSEVPEKKSPVGSILAIVLLLGLAGGLGWLYVNRDRLAGEEHGGGRAAVTAASNLIPSKFWSFEPHEIDPSAEEQAGWHKEDAVDPASTGEVGEASRSGDQAWSIERREVEGAGLATWVSLSGGAECDISVIPGATYRLGGWARLESGEPAAGFGVTWMEPVAGEDAREIAREVVTAAAERGKWTEASGLVQAPEGATRARVGLVLGGVGEALFDDVVLDGAQAPAERAVEVRGFRAWVEDSGALRVFHFARPVSDGIGVWRAGPQGLEPPWQAFVPGRGGAAVSGKLRDGGGSVSVSLAPADQAFRARWEISGASAAHAILIPLPGGADEINVTLLDGDRARRMRAAFQGAAASGVIVGGQGDRMRIRFLEAEDKGFTGTLDVVVQGGRAFLKLDRGDRGTVVLQCDLSFDAELSQARELIARAQDASGRGRFGEAMTLYEEVLARFPFDETTERQASSALERLTSEGRARIRTLAARVDDAKFFRTARIEDDLVAEMQADLDRYANTNLHAELKAKLDELVAERAKSASEKHDAEARRAYMRAQDYLDMKQGRREVAIALLEMVVARYPGTDWSQQAQALLEKLKSG